MEIPATLSYELGNSLKAGDKLGEHKIVLRRSGAETLHLGVGNGKVVTYELSNDSRGDLVWALSV